ncbi:alpha/beta hydrolase [Dactylosporangium fulvum]|uniref:Alpha/beta hydrolase n=1 Tax=Dactylosporangium fulvum TaxID=53359 RepID=A0ABY5VNL4_9ACTN|nr:alpha/beta hydrolase [Dactylosporangium fulvum]UWP79312.1 alpha/beta hydrolase [Dactylosporangium fulvum]
MTYAQVNGVSLWYEEHGQGEPLVLMGGGFWSIGAFGPLLPALAARRRVIAVELQGHGHTADVDRPIRYETMGDDVAALVRHLGLGPVDVMGYSLGAGTALRAAIQHPGLFRHLVSVSMPLRRSAWFPEVLEGMAQLGPEAAEGMRQSPLYAMYAEVAPRVEDWPVLATKIGELARRDYDWSAEIPTITARTMLVYADADSMPVTQAAEFFALLGGGLRDALWDGSRRPAARLAILPGRTHYDVTAAPELPALVDDFLSG